MSPGSLWDVFGGVARLPKIKPNAASSPQVQLDSVYNVLTFDDLELVENPTRRILTRTYQVTGDHLTVVRIRGPRQLYLRFGPTMSLFPLREGMTIRRAFSRIDVSIANDSEAFSDYTQRTRALFVTSFGTMIESVGEKRYGFTSGMQAVDQFGLGSFGTTPIRLLDFFNAVDGDDSAFASGGTLLVRNMDLANTCYVTNAAGGSAPGGGVGFPILPGETLSLQMEDNLSNHQSAKDATLWVSTKAGSCTVSMLYSGQGVDRYDWVQRVREAIT